VTVPDDARRIPSTVGGLVYLLVVAASGIGLLVVAFGPWRNGVGIIGVALIVGALCRFVLSDNNAGMLRVRRNRWVDVLMLGGVGVALLVLASVIPNQPG
jgi:Protein of unknown function (DUF3017)